MKNNKIKIFLILLCIPLIGLLFLQIHNLISYPINHGLDTLDHIDYISYLKTYHRIPLAKEGWELYQPPLYYVIGSFLPSVMSLRIIHLFMYLLLIFSIYKFIQYETKNNLISLMGTLIAGTLPVIIYMTPPISNEFFSGVMISITMIWYLLHKKKSHIKSQIILGILLGLSILSKSTAIVLVITLLVDAAFEFLKKRDFKIVKPLVLPLIIMLIIGGWFYIRNITLFKNPFISSVDFPKYAIHQSPGYRDIKFFTDLSGFLKLDLFQAHHYSLWAGTYFSWFYDGHNIIIPVQEFSKIGNILILFSIPIFIMFILGYILELKKKQSKNLVLLLYPVLIFGAYILYNFKLPFYSTVKAIFLISCIVPFIYFITQSILKLNKKYYIYIVGFLFLYSILVIKAFWILPKWYY